MGTQVGFLYRMASQKEQVACCLSIHLVSSGLTKLLEFTSTRTPPWDTTTRREPLVMPWVTGLKPEVADFSAFPGGGKWHPACWGRDPRCNGSRRAGPSTSRHHIAAPCPRAGACSLGVHNHAAGTSITDWPSWESHTGLGLSSRSNFFFTWLRELRHRTCSLH